MKPWPCIGMLLLAWGLFAFPSRLRADENEDRNAMSEDAKLVTFFRAYLDELFEDQPLTATRLGDHRFDDRLDDISAEARAANLERDRRTLAKLSRGRRLREAHARRSD